jgi:hypothetical protein
LDAVADNGVRFTIPKGRHAGLKKKKRRLAVSIRGFTHSAGDLPPGVFVFLCVKLDLDAERDCQILSYSI